ncbi:MAG: endonuclease III [Bacteroidota bacterium]
MSMKSRSATPPSDDERKRARTALSILKDEFPEAKTALGHENPFQLLVATILSAQCTDKRVNKVTPGLFRKYPDARSFAHLSNAVLEEEIRSTGFFRMKAKSIIGCSKALVERHSGQVPESLDELVNLPGVGRKTANVVMGHAFGVPSGVVVDTHVHRLSQRLGWSARNTPEKIEEDLMVLFPREDWIDVGSILIFHGRKTCPARKPRCGSCSLRQLCPSADSYLSASS